MLRSKTSQTPTGDAWFLNHSRIPMVKKQWKSLRVPEKVPTVQKGTKYIVYNITFAFSSPWTWIYQYLRTCSVRAVAREGLWAKYLIEKHICHGLVCLSRILGRMFQLDFHQLLMFSQRALCFNMAYYLCGYPDFDNLTNQKPSMPALYSLFIQKWWWWCCFPQLWSYSL